MKKFNDDQLEYYDCFECKARMDLVDDVLVCPNCGHSVELEEWAFEEEAYEEFQSSFGYTSALEQPECCRACGGPWPDCETSCKIFDD